MTIEGIAHSLVGTTDSEPEDMIEWSVEDCAKFDSIVFRCAHCNWWCSADECNDSKFGEWICDDCKEEEGEDD